MFCRYKDIYKYDSRQVMFYALPACFHIFFRDSSINHTGIFIVDLRSLPGLF